VADINSGLVLHCTWHRHVNGKEWISFPARGYEHPHGGVSWAPVVEFAAGAKKARGFPEPGRPFTPQPKPRSKIRIQPEETYQ
jgi:hypothetical protein